MRDGALTPCEGCGALFPPHNGPTHKYLGASAHKLEPPPLGSALTWRHLFPGGGVSTPVTRGQYAVSVYETWIALHRSIVEEWYERYVVPDDVRAHK
jgi:hypothetical protein